MNTGAWGYYCGEKYDIIEKEEDLEKLFHCIKANILSKQKHIEKLYKELKELREEYNKDEHIAALIEEGDRYKEDYFRGFPISEAEKKLIDRWIEEHDNEHKGGYGTSGGKYDYIFTPTAIGTVGVIKCSCGKEFCFQGL